MRTKNRAAADKAMTARDFARVFRDAFEMREASFQATPNLGKYHMSVQDAVMKALRARRLPLEWTDPIVCLVAQNAELMERWTRRFVV